MGNDFLPHIPTIDIKKGGLEILMYAYIETYVKYFVPLIKFNNKKVDVNVLFFDDLVAQLSIYEKEFMESIEFENTQTIRPKFEKKVDEKIWELENMKIITSNDIYQRYIGSFDDWKFRYYEHHIGCMESQDVTIKKMCQNYLDGMIWVANYYFCECPSLSWSYEYSHAPFLSDLSKFIKSQQYNINNIDFDNNIQINAITQLMCVIPPLYKDLLPPNYSDLMTYSSVIGDLFPTQFELDTKNKTTFRQCIPILPKLDIFRINNAIQCIPCTKNIMTINEIQKCINIK